MNAKNSRGRKHFPNPNKISTDQKNIEAVKEMFTEQKVRLARRMLEVPAGEKSYLTPR